MSDPTSSDPPNDDAPRPRRPFVPVPGVIDLDAVEDDARNALWGSNDDNSPLGTEGATPPQEDIPPPPARPASPEPEIIAAPDNTRVETPPTPVAEDLNVASPKTPSDELATPPSADVSSSRQAVAQISAGATPTDASSPRWTEATKFRGTPTAATAEEPVASPKDARPKDTSPTATPPPSSPPEASPPSTTQETPIIPASLRPPDVVVQTAKEATKDRGRELVALVTEYGKRHIPETPPKTAEPDTGPPRLVGRIGQILPFMKSIPWLLAAGFGASFLWDFPNAEVTVFGNVIPLAGMLRILSISGMIGFLTNWLAITMLFQPREKRAIIPQGLIPAQRERVIYRLSDAISRELINADIIKQKIQESGVIGRYRDLGLTVVRGVVEDPGFRSDLKALAQQYAQETLGSKELRRELAQIAVNKVEQQAGQGLGGVALKLYRTFAEDDFQRRVDNALSELPLAVTPLLDRIDHALDSIPAKVEARGVEIEEAATKAVLSFVESFDIQSMIREKARGFDEAQLENLLKSTSNEQLNYIKYLGGILGVFGGLVIWRAEMLIVFLIVGLALWAVDEIWVRARRRTEAGS